MAKQTTAGYTNTTASSKSITLTQLGLGTNYAEVDSQNGDYILDNITAPTDQTERIRINSRATKNVALNSGVINEYPDDTSGMSLVVGMDVLLSTTDTDVPEYRVDDGLSFTMTIKYGKTARVTDTAVETALQRFYSIFYDDNGACRLPVMLRGSKRINTD